MKITEQPGWYDRYGGDVAVFCIPMKGHMQRVLAVVSGLVRMGCRVHVYTGQPYGETVEKAGGRFVDFYSKYPVQPVDNYSLPKPCRHVSHAGYYLDAVTREIAELSPSLIVYDTFAVIGQAVAVRLGIPYVNICSGHNQTPARLTECIESLAHVAVSPACEAAVDKLQQIGLPGVTPFYYYVAVSPYLNLYCEPPQFLRPGESDSLEPLMYFGSLDPPSHADDPPVGRNAWPGDQLENRRLVYVSFGTIIWRYFTDLALAAMKVISDAIARMPDVSALISLGNADVSESQVRSLTQPNVRVESYVCQWRILEHADAVIAHHGLNSTHEAVYHRVPMISYPFFSDQPDQALRCEELGLSTSLTNQPRRPITEDDVRTALKRVFDDAVGYNQRLTQARQWELNVIESRQQVLQAVVDQARPTVV